MNLPTFTRRQALRASLAAVPLVGLLPGIRAAKALLAPPEPATFEVMAAYNEWLFYERRLLAMEMYPGHPDADAAVRANTGVMEFHFPCWPERWQDRPQPSTRAALVLSTVGIDLDHVQRFCIHHREESAVGEARP